MRDLDGKIALVTGASRGIGLSTAKLLTEKGAKVYTAQRRKGEHHWLEADFNDLQTPKKILSQIKNLEGRLDILVNNAGIMREGNAEETSESDWFEQININLNIPFLFIKIHYKTRNVVLIHHPQAPPTSSLRSFLCGSLGWSARPRR